MTAAAAPVLALDGIGVEWPGSAPGAPGYVAVEDVSLSVGRGEFLSVVGPTGCGKSTLLNVAAGLLAPSSGAVLVAGERLSGLNRRAGYLFQQDALMPWKTALANVAVALEPAGVRAQAAREQALIERQQGDSRRRPRNPSGRPPVHADDGNESRRLRALRAAKQSRIGRRGWLG